MGQPIVHHSLLIMSREVEFANSFAEHCRSFGLLTATLDDYTEAISLIANCRPAAICFDLDAPCIKVESVFSFLSQNPILASIPLLILDANRSQIDLNQCKKSRAYYLKKSRTMSTATRAVLGELLDLKSNRATRARPVSRS